MRNSRSRLTGTMAQCFLAAALVAVVPNVATADPAKVDTNNKATDAKTTDSKAADSKATDTKSSETKSNKSATDSKSSDTKTADSADKKKPTRAQLEAMLSKCSDEADAKGLSVAKGKGAARKAFRRECMHKMGVDPR